MDSASEAFGVGFVAAGFAVGAALLVWRAVVWLVRRIGL